LAQELSSKTFVPFFFCLQPKEMRQAWRRSFAGARGRTARKTGLDRMQIEPLITAGELPAGGSLPLFGVAVVDGVTGITRAARILDCEGRTPA
jgi:hypothetical protein